MLSKLTPATNPWYQQARGERQQLSLDLFNDMTHLTNLLLSLDAKPPHFSSARTSKLLADFLSPEEAHYDDCPVLGKNNQNLAMVGESCRNATTSST